MPARILRNFNRYLIPRVSMPSGWSVSPVAPAEIPASLLPRSSAAEVVSLRNPKLLEHILQCPAFSEAHCYLLKRLSQAAAYFCLANVRGQTRLIDYGPCGLDRQTATVMGIAAQEVARSSLRTILDIVAATTERPVISGLSSAGFRFLRQESIKVFKLRGAADSTDHYRMTLLDWDAACL